MTVTRKASLPKRAFKLLQKMGKSLLFPIAMLPIAAIFLRVGDAIPGTTDFSEFISKLFLAIGNSVFGWALPFIFAIGIAFGMTKDQRGEAAITGFAVMLVLSILLSSSGPFGGYDFVDRVYGGMTLNGGHGFHGVMGVKAYDNVLAKNVFIGIFAGGLVSYLYNRFNGVELPSVLGFFSGRRLIPVLSMMSTIFLGLLLSLVFPWIGAGLFYIGKGMGEAKGNQWGNAGIMGGYGIINRLLIPFGLHHVINAPVWFTEVGGTQHGVAGDINIFGQVPASWIEGTGANAVTHINNAGTFQSGFFPTMMFGLPAIAAAIWFNADGQTQKAKVASLFAGSALVSFFTGITEPIEFSFMFLAPALYGLHALLTGLFGFIVGAFGIQLGFGFSAGLVDYVLSLPKSIDIAAAKGGVQGVMANPAWMWLIGAVAAATYFFSANFMIKKLNISTPGRGNNLLDETVASAGGATAVTAGSTTRAAKYVKALGGYENITMYSHCATRLRYDIIDDSKVDDKALQSAGAFGVAHPSKTHVQVIVGPTVEIVNNEILAGKPEDAKAIVKTSVATTMPDAKKPTTTAKKPAVKKATTTAKKPAAKPVAKKPTTTVKKPAAKNATTTAKKPAAKK